MGAHVCRQDAGLREGHATGDAWVWAIAGMGAHVDRQMAGLNKSLAAGDAGVRAITGVGAHVYSQVAGCHEGIAACSAWVGTVAGMGSHVRRQVSGLRARLAADGTLKDELVAPFSPPPLTRCSRTSTLPFTASLLPLLLASEHHQVKHFEISGQKSKII